jgi:hypothetical protein
MRKSIFIVPVCVLMCSISAYAAFEQQSWSARAAAMGDAFVSCADDGSSALYNPAGIGLLETPEINGMYSWVLPGLDFQHLGLMAGSITMPFKKEGSFSVAIASFSAAGLYQENTIIFNYANRLSSFMKSKDSILKNLVMGINIKYMGHGYLSDSWKDELVFANGTTKYSFTFDAGVMTRFYLKDSSDYFAAGLAVFNIIEPDVGLLHPDLVPMTIKFGFSYPLKRYKFFKKYRIESPVPAVAVTYQDGNFDFHAGWENEFFDGLISFRLGTSLEAFSTGLGFNIATGKVMTIHLNYCFSFPYNILDSSGNHKVSFAMDF